MTTLSIDQEPPAPKRSPSTPNEKSSALGDRTVRPQDPSANIYLSAAALLGSAVEGINAKLPLPEEVAINSAESTAKRPWRPTRSST